MDSTLIRIQHKTQKIKISFRALPTPLTEWQGTAEQLHRIIFDRTMEYGIPLDAHNDMLEALKAAQPLLVAALAFVDCKKLLAQVEQAIKTAEGQ